MTRDEAIGIRKALDSLVTKIADIPAEINENLAAIRAWAPGPFAVGAVRVYDSIPYKCLQDHDSADNPDWTPPVTPALWMQYHGTSKATARLWVQPLGSEDRYRSGEWMIWTDGLAYPCLNDTTYNPAEWPGAWGAPEEIA